MSRGTSRAGSRGIGSGTATCAPAHAQTGLLALLELLEGIRTLEACCYYPCQTRPDFDLNQQLTGSIAPDQGKRRAVFYWVLCDKVGILDRLRRRSAKIV